MLEIVATISNYNYTIFVIFIDLGESHFLTSPIVINAIDYP